MFKCLYAKKLLWVAAVAVVVGTVFPVMVKANNPVIPTNVSTADPAPCGPWNDTVYLYCTQDDNAALGITNIRCWSTTDMYHWKDWGVVLTEANVAWSNRGSHLWAPHVVYFNGRYHMYFPETASSGTFYIGHATNSTSPHTTFTAATQQMVINGARTATAYTDGALDPFVIMDTAGTNDTNYLAWCITGITPNRNYIGRLSASGDSVLGTPSTLRNIQDVGSDFYPGTNHYVEGQWWIQNASRWYHIYACYYPGGAEQIGCATCTTTVAALRGSGTYTYRGWLMGTNANSAAGTIHPGCVLYHGRWYLFWHCGGYEFGGSLLGGSAMRSTGAEYFQFNTGSNPPAIVSPQTPTTNWSIPKTYRGVGIPNAHSDTIQIDRRRTTSDISGASIDTFVISGQTYHQHIVTGIGNGSWVRYDSVDFTPSRSDSAIGRIVAQVATSNATDTIQVRLETSTGTLYGSIALPNTGGVSTWATTAFTNLTTNIPSGVRNLVLVFRGTANSMRVNWVKFGQVYVPTAVRSGSVAVVSKSLSFQRLNRNTFNVSGANINTDIKLFNLMGREIVTAVASMAAVHNGITVTLDSKALTSGTYLLKAKSSKGKSVQYQFVY